jgi:hypothetical protein
MIHIDDYMIPDGYRRVRRKKLGWLDLYYNVLREEWKVNSYALGKLPDIGSVDAPHTYIEPCNPWTRTRTFFCKVGVTIKKLFEKPALTQ